MSFNFKKRKQENLETLENEEEVLTNNVALKIEDLHKSYGQKEVLKGLNLEVNKGEVFGFIGKNGVGKSTTIDCIVGLKDFNSGTIKIFDKDNVKKSILTKSMIGYVSSEPVAYEMMTGREYLIFVASCYGVKKSTFKENLDFLLSKLTFSKEDLERRISDYSHGMKQKICLIASLIHNPKIWILDEPSVGLDAMVYETLVSMIKEYAAHGNTVFITSHNIELVMKVCDRVAIINDGVVSELIDFKKEPLRRKNLYDIFVGVYKK